jgi:hypothetical protein
MAAEFRDGLLGISGQPDQDYVRLRTDDRFESLSKERMILDAQDSNGAGVSHTAASFQILGASRAHDAARAVERGASPRAAT